MPAWQGCGRRVEGNCEIIGAVCRRQYGVGWLWTAADAIHFIGLCLLFVVVLIVIFGFLGMAKGVSFKALTSCCVGQCSGSW